MSSFWCMSILTKGQLKGNLTNAVLVKLANMVAELVLDGAAALGRHFIGWYRQKVIIWFQDARPLVNATLLQIRWLSSCSSMGAGGNSQFLQRHGRLAGPCISVRLNLCSVS